MSSWHVAEFSAGTALYFYSTDMCYELSCGLRNEYHLVNSTDFHFLLVFPLLFVSLYPSPSHFHFLHDTIKCIVRILLVVSCNYLKFMAGLFHLSQIL